MSTTEATRKTPTSTGDSGSQLTAENRSVEVAEDLFVYRRFGNARTDVPPLLCLQHFRGNLDNWDPALVDRLVQDREVILLDNRGVGASTGVVADNVTDMTRDVLRFIDALELKQVDVLGFSLGAYIAQELALLRPRVLRRIVLAGTASQGAPNVHPWTDDVYALATPDEPSPDRFTKGREYLERVSARQVDRDEPTDLATRDAQLTAITLGNPRPHRSSAAWQLSPSRRSSPTATTTR